MRRIAYLLTLLAVCGGLNVMQGQELLSYSRQDGTSGLRLAWRADSTQAWTPIGKDYNFVNSDFGPWGSHKKMFSPRLICNAGRGGRELARGGTASLFPHGCKIVNRSKRDMRCAAVSPRRMSFCGNRDRKSRLCPGSRILSRRNTAPDGACQRPPARRNSYALAR